MNTIAEIFTISFFCVGLHQAAEKDFLLHIVDVWCRKLPDWLYLPLIGCPYCMASIWGTVIYWVLEYIQGIQTTDFIRWPIICFACICLNGLIYEALKNLRGE